MRRLYLALVTLAPGCAGPVLDLGGSAAPEDAAGPELDGGPRSDAAQSDAGYDGSCDADDDCPLATKSRCELTLQRCVQCLTNADCNGNRCEQGEWHCESN